MKQFKAFRVHNENNEIAARFDQLDLDQVGIGNVVIRSAFSNVNYKDALAATGTGRIMKRFPLVAGIDAAGYVHTSEDPRFKEGDPVVVVGCGLGEEYDGGFAEYVKVKGDWIAPLPDGLSLYETMALGTAGFTAGMAIQRMEEGTYGVCESCGQPIPAARLRALPSATYCVQCKEAMEASEPWQDSLSYGRIRDIPDAMYDPESVYGSVRGSRVT